MQRSHLVAVLVASGCWTGSTLDSTPPIHIRPIVDPPPDTCVEAGEQLHVEACRRGESLTWMLSNRGATTLWVFVAPPIGGRMASQNALAIDNDGEVVLSKKFIRKQVGDHPYVVGAISLPPGHSAEGVLPLEEPYDNLVRLNTQPLRWFTVALEVGYAEVEPTDRLSMQGEFHVVLPFKSERQHLVRTPAIRWR